MNQNGIENLIAKASERVGKTWPLYSFVTSNPLSGYENAPFLEAVEQAGAVFGCQVFPKADMYRMALENGEIAPLELEKLLKEKGYTKSFEHYLELMDTPIAKTVKNPYHQLDRSMVKWLSSFMDEGLAEWEMPFKAEGFYKAWRKLVTYDGTMGKVKLSTIPKTHEAALEQLVSGYDEGIIQELFIQHLAALPGWTGYINHRTQNLPLWQQKYPIDLAQYLAVRLWSAKLLKLPVLWDAAPTNQDTQHFELKYLWLKAWEKSWQNRLVHTLKQNAPSEEIELDEKAPDAQMVFCIDTRSELIRRHVEANGNYETFGYAGFFGIAMDYESPNDGHVHKACPPIVPSSYTVSEKTNTDKMEAKKVFERKNSLQIFWNYFLKRMKNMLPSTFGFVEGAGFFYGINLLGRTLVPDSLYRWHNRKKTYESISEPELLGCNASDKELQIPIESKTAIVKSAFDLMGWQQFAPLVLFVGHGSHSANNPFGSSLDCGACAASPGRHNARMLAQLANDKNVRQALKEQFQLEIPETTLFVGAEHNTTTDEIILFDANAPESHENALKKIKANLAKAQVTATQERLGTLKNSIGQAQFNANYWGETRPEWGLAKNASFVIAPRTMTQNHNLDGRCFLHSYDWKMDKKGTALEAIMQGPMVVTQWINNHYYFSTVDNEKFGGGTKTTHNVTGKFGVVQGNGGDLKMGLPWESLFDGENNPYHKPLRLSVVIQAPLDRVTSILFNNDGLKSLLDNEWIYLIVLDPEKGMSSFTYDKRHIWLEREETATPSKKENRIIEEVML